MYLQILRKENTYFFSYTIAKIEINIQISK